jgi:hypothetical protein
VNGLAGRCDGVSRRDAEETGRRKDVAPAEGQLVPATLENESGFAARPTSLRLFFFGDCIDCKHAISGVNFSAPSALSPNAR